MDRLQEWEGLHGIDAHEAALYDDRPANEVLRHALFGAVSTPPGPSVSIVALVMANRQVGCGHVS
jgi:hypothetical protein